MKKTISTILILCMALTSMIGIFAFPTSAATTITGDTAWPGNATTTDGAKTVYHIYDENDMYTFATMMKYGIRFTGITVVLENDIDFNEGWDATTVTAPTNRYPMCGRNNAAETALATEDSAFTGIITPVEGTDGFDGTLDGQGHTISGIYVENMANGWGIFGKSVASSAAEFKNFTIANSIIHHLGYNSTGLYQVGTDASATFENVNIESDVTLMSDNNGSVAFFSGDTWGDVTIRNCIVKGNILHRKDGAFALAGFIGRTNKSSTVIVESSAMYGDIEGKTERGAGIIGCLDNNDSATITNVIVGGYVQVNGGNNKIPLIRILGSGVKVTASGNLAVLTMKSGESLSGSANNVPCKLITATDAHSMLTGISAQATLNEAGNTAFVASAIGLPVLKGTVVSNEVANAATKYEGYQVRKNANGTMDVRLVGSINADIEDIKNYEAVGFTVVAYYQNDAAAKVQAKDLAKTQVYTSVIADGVEWTPAGTLTDTYLFVHGFKGIATDKGPVVFEITTFYTDANGATVVGGTNTVTVSAN